MLNLAVARARSERFDNNSSTKQQAVFLQSLEERIALLEERLAALEVSEHFDPMLTNILDAVSAFYLVGVRDIKSERRSKDIVRARRMAMYLSRTLTRLSFPVIAKFLCKHYSTVIHTFQWVDAHKNTDSKLKSEIDELERRLNRGD